MNYILLFVSVLMETAKNAFSNHFSKTKLNTISDALFYNIICCVGSVVFCAFIPLGRISTYSLVLSVVMALTTTGMLVFSLLAMKHGPMSYSMLIMTLGMIIPTVFGIIYNKQIVSGIQIIGFILMLVTLWLGTDKSANKSFSLKWLFFAMMSFVGCGCLGIVQLLHQSSPYKGEINIFIMFNFIFSAVLSGILLLFCKKGESKASLSLVKGSMLPVGLISGLFFGAVNIINLDLSGKLPSILFFPATNGGLLVLSSIAAVTVFREKMSVKQAIGIATGIVAICMLGI